ETGTADLVGLKQRDVSAELLGLERGGRAARPAADHNHLQRPMINHDDVTLRRSRVHGGPVTPDCGGRPRAALSGPSPEAVMSRPRSWPRINRSPPALSTRNEPAVPGT